MMLIFFTLDIKDFYLMTSLPRPEYLRVPLKFLSEAILDKHNHGPFIHHNNSILFEVTKSMYGLLPHASKIAQDVLVEERLASHDYLQTGLQARYHRCRFCPSRRRLWRKIQRRVLFNCNCII
jgi:hypothetical protein